MTFKLNESQLKKLEEWKNALTVVFGDCGELTYAFRPTGLGDVVEVNTSHGDLSLDLTDVASW